MPGRCCFYHVVYHFRDEKGEGEVTVLPSQMHIAKMGLNN